MKKIVILASGRGSNAEAIYNFSKTNAFEIAAIISDNAKALVLEKAKNWNVPAIAVPRQVKETRGDHEARLMGQLKKLDFDLIVLAGYARLLSQQFLSEFPPRTIVNIHPSLLPLYPGLNSYQRAFADGVKESGITIHFVDEGMDTGEIILQEKFSREPSDDLESFEKRGLALEHKHYPEAIATILNQNFLYRVEIYPKKANLLAKPENLTAKLFWIKSEGPLPRLQNYVNDVLIDSVVEKAFIHQDRELESHLEALGFHQNDALEVSFLPGVTDNTAFSVRDAFKKHPELRGKELSVFSGKLIFVKGETKTSFRDKAFTKYANSWLEKVAPYSTEELRSPLRFHSVHVPDVHLKETEVHYFDLNVSDEALVELSKNQLWALSLEELHFVRDHFKSLERKPSDVEMEIIAQTWSEHCKHKIFAATIEHEDQDGKRTVQSVFKTFIKGATSRILEEGKIDWARSVFTDNAGIVRWDPKLDVCIKVETHNSPSALDPYGGALTGILGVNRDILGCGLGAKPIANTDVFCLPPEEADADGAWPKELHSPKRIRAGVHKGVQDGGNKSGIPTVNGAFYYDLSYSGKPLVYCGTIGVLPHKIGEHHSHEKNQKPGDLVVMVGGRIGKDGIHGATFSSLELKEGTPSTVVQIGDPLTQKRVTDFLLKARDLNLYTSITDNGAGGLSSSVGEMSAATNGAVIDLALAPVKYQGLSPAELMISESQERMTCAVNPAKWAEFKKLADDFNVEVSNLGTFTDDGYFTILYQSKEVAKLSLSFLHDDLPPMKLKSTWTPNYPRAPWKNLETKRPLKTIKDKVFALLSHENIRSHEGFVRQYDHEVKAASVTKPFSPSGAPSDAGVISMKPHGGGEHNGVAISSGLAPAVSLKDSRLMAMYSIDEAVRNAVVTGADPEKMVLVDNFCWPDPLPGPNNPDYSQKLGELVRANEGLYEMAVELGMPFVSGKDSMKNDAIVNFDGRKTKISVLPTLLITCMGHIENVEKVVRAAYHVDEDLWLLGGDEELNSYTLSTFTHKLETNWPEIAPRVLKERYRSFYYAIKLGLISGAHDVSEGGVLVALVEMALNSKLGFELTNLDETKYFGEGMGMIVFSASASKRDAIRQTLKGAKMIGYSRNDDLIGVNQETFTVGDALAAYKGEKP
jgi:phosphoribosylformylglycinamidine synthase II/formyltetrahydrofolate-dependent phosphoribosylglycinamide formyltransferase